MRATRFPARAEGIADRMAGFIAHLRMNGLSLGPRETIDALAALAAVEATDAAQARMALAALLAGDAEEWRRFDQLFDAYWFNDGRARTRNAPAPRPRAQAARPKLWQPHFEQRQDDGAGAEPDEADGGAGDAQGAEGRLVATRAQNLLRRDLRELMDEESLARAEAAALALARAIRDRLSRRRRAAARGQALDMRRIMRKSLARGGEPLELHRRARPPRPMRIVALLDVSGSMSVHARVFLAFLRGLVGAADADAYLFHTRLMRVTDALRDHDTLRAASRLSLMAEGFGGGTDISGCLERFMQGHGARALGRRTLVMIVSDGYCTSPPERLGAAMAQLRRKARRVVWLNPLGGWREHAPAARAMAAARPHLDAALPANTLEALAALEDEFSRL
ncbi:vWA domain-containing protein [Oceanicella actignis]|uniref:vWA domain-containing protein n=1 Tax=Oceanicella actignis TaxID=1189325 RepID=UPI00125993E9|nr:VWA domain-containing protein [Oceanicella actignis]TYO90910.1 uncharacterized protein with von Willebrand factor type A (vWA) domain [Oceanicella actignis]